MKSPLKSCLVNTTNDRAMRASRRREFYMSGAATEKALILRPTYLASLTVGTVSRTSTADHAIATEAVLQGSGSQTT